MFENSFFFLFCRMTPRCRKVLSKSLHLRCGLSYSYFTCSNFWSPSSSWPSTTSWDKMYSRFNFCKVDDLPSNFTLSIFTKFCESKVKPPKKWPNNPSKNHQKITNQVHLINESKKSQPPISDTRSSNTRELKNLTVTLKLENKSTLYLGR